MWHLIIFSQCVKNMIPWKVIPRWIIPRVFRIGNPRWDFISALERSGVSDQASWETDSDSCLNPLLLPPAETLAASIQRTNYFMAASECLHRPAHSHQAKRKNITGCVKGARDRNTGHKLREQFPGQAVFSNIKFVKSLQKKCSRPVAPRQLQAAPNKFQDQSN